jgi:hypothetical protein
MSVARVSNFCHDNLLLHPNPPVFVPAALKYLRVLEQRNTLPDWRIAKHGLSYSRLEIKQ